MVRAFRISCGFTAVLALALLLPAGANAQSGGGATPTREELDRAGQALPDSSGGPRLTVEGGVERAPCPLADPRFAGVTVNFADVRFDHLGDIDPAILRDSWADMAGQDLPIASVCEIRDRAATALRQMGYLAAVQVPPQRIEKGGTVVFDVLLAKLVSVQVRGDAGNSEKLIADSLEALKDEPVFNAHQAERRLLLLRDLPGYDVRLALRPAGTAPGEVVGEVSVTRQQIQLAANVQNLGSHEVGRWGGLLRLQINDATGMGDSTVLSVFNTAQTREQTVLQASHSMALNADGLRLAGNYTYAWSKPDVVNGKIKSRTQIASAELSYPLIRRQSITLLGTAGLEIVDQDVDFANNPLNRDKLRVFYGKLDFETIDPESLSSTLGYTANEPKYRLGGSLEIRQGISGLGASSGCKNPFTCLLSRPEGDPSAFVVRANGYAEYRPVPEVTVAVAPRLQYSADALLSYEEISGGNYTVGRGYDPGAIIGDSGAGATVELRYGSVLPKSPKDLALQPFAFFDAAYVWNRDSQFDGLNPQKIYSAGGGIRGSWGNRARFELTVAAPLKKTIFQQERGDVRVLFSITTQLVPWR